MRAPLRRGPTDTGGAAREGLTVHPCLGPRPSRKRCVYTQQLRSVPSLPHLTDGKLRHGDMERLARDLTAPEWGSRCSGLKVGTENQSGDWGCEGGRGALAHPPFGRCLRSCVPSRLRWGGGQAVLGSAFRFQRGHSQGASTLHPPTSTRAPEGLSSPRTGPRSPGKFQQLRDRLGLPEAPPGADGVVSGWPGPAPPVAQRSPHSSAEPSRRFPYGVRTSPTATAARGTCGRHRGR